MNAGELAHYRSFVTQFEQRPEWVPFLRNLKSDEVNNHPELANLSAKLLTWAELYLGANYRSALAEGYVAFVTDVNRSQLKYEMKGSYQNKSYSDVFKAVYDNKEFMKYYHWGVYVTTFAWPHHLEIYRFFRERFLLPYVVTTKANRMVDLGCGSGLWSLLTLERMNGMSVDAVDISETSSRFAAEMAACVGMSGRFRTHRADALSWGEEKGGQFDAAISCFLLEHLETPDKLLNNLSRLLKPRAVAFVTGALTAAEVDHIKEFKRESELVEMAENAGFRVMETMSASPKNYTITGKYLPRSMAMILSKRAGEIW